VKLLLDTHTLLWWLADEARIGARAKDMLADPRHDVLVSVVSLWEIVVKQRIGKLEAEVEAIAKAVDQGGFRWLDISVPHLMTLASLPMHHRDPFDHLLIAQAITEGAVFVSEDGHVARYPVQAMTCSDQPPGPGPA
jgi:PIN domain nuclease of toxin-antitoxin system